MSCDCSQTYTSTQSCKITVNKNVSNDQNYNAVNTYTGAIDGAHLEECLPSALARIPRFHPSTAHTRNQEPGSGDRRIGSSRPPSTMRGVQGSLDSMRPCLKRKEKLHKPITSVGAALEFYFLLTAGRAVVCFYQCDLRYCLRMYWQEGDGNFSVALCYHETMVTYAACPWFGGVIMQPKQYYIFTAQICLCFYSVLLVSCLFKRVVKVKKLLNYIIIKVLIMCREIFILPCLF